jgi:hypothetical protein
MSLEITKISQHKIQNSHSHWYTVEDTRIDLSCDGFTISYGENNDDDGPTRVSHIVLNQDQAVAIANSILEIVNQK